MLIHQLRQLSHIVFGIAGLRQTRLFIPEKIGDDDLHRVPRGRLVPPVIHPELFRLERLQQFPRHLFDPAYLRRRQIRFFQQVEDGLGFRGQPPP